MSHNPLSPPWTFEPFEADQVATTAVYDPNLACIVAVFYDPGEAADYLAWRNKKQAKLAAKAAKKKATTVAALQRYGGQTL